MMKWLAKPILWLFTSAIPVFISACYGCPDGGCGPDFDDTEAFLTGKVVNTTGAGIPNILVSCMNGDADAGATVESSVYTMAGDGAYTLELSSAGCDFIRFEDVDGQENGSYQSKDVPRNDAQNAAVELQDAE